MVPFVTVPQSHTFTVGVNCLLEIWALMNIEPRKEVAMKIISRVSIVLVSGFPTSFPPKVNLW